MRELNDLFLGIDKDGDGMVSADELRQALAGKWSPDQIQRLVEVLIGDSGAVAYDEFMGQLIASKAPQEKQLLQSIFAEADADMNGYINQYELGLLMKRPAVEKVLGGKRPADVMQLMDPSGTGRISFEDFCRGFYGDSVCEFNVNQAVEFYSSSFSSWIPCEVCKVDDKSGAIQITAKPDFWLSKAEASKRVRPRKISRTPVPPIRGAFQMPPIQERQEAEQAKMSGMGRQLFHGGLSGGEGPKDVISDGKDIMKRGMKQFKKLFG